MTTEVTTNLLDEKEARAFAESIKKRLGDVRKMIIELHDRMGWAVLGYKSWEACVKQEFDWSESYVGRQIAAGRIEQKLLSNTPQTGEGSLPIGRSSPPISPIPESQLRPLISLPEDEQADAYLEAKETADKEEKPLTAAAVQAMVDKYKGENAAMEESFEEPDEPEEEEPEEPPTVEERMKFSNSVLEKFAREITALGTRAEELAEPHLTDRLDTLQAQLRTAAGTVRVAKGAGVCSYCDDGAGCKHCHQTGWLNKTAFESAPEK